MTLESRLKEIKDRCDAATEGPWETNYNGNTFLSVSGDEIAIFRSNYFVSKDWERFPFSGDKPKDVSFIAHARTDIPMLLEMVEYLLDEVTMANFGRKDPFLKLEKIAEKYK